jgi:glucose-1-phosphate thymidylyltransferase
MGLSQTLQDSAHIQEGAIVFAYPVRDPQRYGVIEFDPQGKALSIEEKPEKPRSNYAVPGIYFYDRRVTDLAANLKPSPRNELEITDLNRIYLEDNLLRVKLMGRGIAWLDAGTHESLLQAANFVQTVEERQGLMIACPEEIAYHMGYISSDELLRQAQRMNNSYGDYLKRLLAEGILNGDPG